ncbi:MAG: BrnT family toxin [Desulfobaccales bacterium]
MRNDAFEWDEIKAAKNYAAHGVSFEAARDVFKDPFAIEWCDDREPYGEDRFVIIGMVEGRLLYVVYTMRGEVIRIISARGAESYEKRRYHEENSY